MCGIAGWIGFREQTPPSLHLDLLAHRGPDDRGKGHYVSASGRVAAVLGSTRLAILDLDRENDMSPFSTDAAIGGLPSTLTKGAVFPCAVLLAG